MNNGRRGASFERQVKADLEGHGYFVARAAGSRGCADLLAVDNGVALLVQAKIGGAGRMPPAEWNELRETAEHHGAIAVIAHRPRRGVIEYLRITGAKTGMRGARPPVTPWSPNL